MAAAAVATAMVRRFQSLSLTLTNTKLKTANKTKECGLVGLGGVSVARYHSIVGAQTRKLFCERDREHNIGRMGVYVSSLSLSRHHHTTRTPLHRFARRAFSPAAAESQSAPQLNSASWDPAPTQIHHTTNQSACRR